MRRSFGEDTNVKTEVTWNHLMKDNARKTVSVAAALRRKLSRAVPRKLCSFTVTHNELIPQIRDQECVDLQSANRHVPDIGGQIGQPRIVGLVE